MLLLALQTATATENDRLDAIALVLVVIFVASMAALSFLIQRRHDEPDDPLLGTPALEDRSPGSSASRAAPQPSLPRPERAPLPAASRSEPIWLDGVTLPSTDVQLTDAVTVIEALLSARRNLELDAALPFLSPAFRATLATRFGIPETALAETLAGAEISGPPPRLRSVELMEGNAQGVIVRAGYVDGRSERYTLVYSADCWLIDAIE